MKQIGVSAQRRADSLKTAVSASGHGQEVTNTNGSEPPQNKESYCLRRMRTLAACYRKDDAADPETYAAAGAAVLCEYDLDVVDFVTDPRTGLPSTSQFLPTIKEIRDACDAMVRAEMERQQRSESLRKQFTERDAFDAEQAAKANRKPSKIVPPLPSERALPAHELWPIWCRDRTKGRITLSEPARIILEAAGYVVDGPDNQYPSR